LVAFTISNLETAYSLGSK